MADDLSNFKQFKLKALPISASLKASVREYLLYC